jgi:hypothetical protein
MGGFWAHQISLNFQNAPLEIGLLNNPDIKYLVDRTGTPTSLYQLPSTSKHEMQYSLWRITVMSSSSSSDGDGGKKQ